MSASRIFGIGRPGIVDRLGHHEEGLQHAPTRRRARRRPSSSCRDRRGLRGAAGLARGEDRAADQPLGDRAHGLHEGRIVEAAIVGDQDRRLPVQLLHRLGIEDRVRRVGDEDHHVGVLLLELQHLRLRIGRVRRIGDFLGDVEAVLGKRVGDDAGHRVTVFGVLVDDRDRVHLLPRGLLFLQEHRIGVGEVGGDRRRAEEPLEAALRQVGSDRFGVEERNDPVEQVMMHDYYVNLPYRSEYSYGLLYSEARLGSLIAIGKGEVPQQHWFRMARTFPRYYSWQQQSPDHCPQNRPHLYFSWRLLFMAGDRIMCRRGVAVSLRR